MYSTFVKTRDVNESTCDFFFNLSILRVLRYSIVDSKYLQDRAISFKIIYILKRIESSRKKIKCVCRFD